MAEIESKPSYWEIRKMILDALKTGDDEELKRIAVEHAGVFCQVVNQARNATSTRQ